MPSHSAARPDPGPGHQFLPVQAAAPRTAREPGADDRRARLRWCGCGPFCRGATRVRSHQRDFTSRTARQQLAFLAAALLLVLAFGAWLRIPQLLTSASGVVSGASYTDVHARIPALRLLIVAARVGALLAVVQAFSVRLWPIALAIGGYFLRSRSAATSTPRRSSASTSRPTSRCARRRSSYNISATRAAFGLDQVEERQLSGDATLTRADLDSNADTIRQRAAVGSPAAARHVLPDPGDPDLLRLRVGRQRPLHDQRRYRQIMLSARELNSESLPNRTWINEQLTFTHGYGLTLGPVNEVTPEGLPILFIKNLPPGLDRRPEGHRAVDLLRRAVQRSRVRQDEHEGVPLPAGDDNVFATLPGQRRRAISGRSAGALLFAIRFRSDRDAVLADAAADTR